MFDADKNFLAQISSLLFDGVEDMGIDEILGRIEELKKDGIVGMIKNVILFPYFILLNLLLKRRIHIHSKRISPNFSIVRHTLHDRH